MATQRALLRSCEFWPTPKEVLAVFADELRHRREMAALRLPAPAPEPDRGERAPEEIAYVQARSAEARAALRAADEPDDPRPVRPAYLSGEMLARARDNPLVRAAKAMQQRERERERADA